MSTYHPSNGDLTEVTLNVPSPARLLLNDLMESNVLLLEDWQALDEASRHDLLEAQTADHLLAILVQRGLLTEYQVGRIHLGESGRLVIGNYRLLDRIGAGGMGIVYRAEHILLRRPVAIKVLHAQPDEKTVVLQRFFVEMRALAQLRHANIVWALDAGTLNTGDPTGMRVHYLVMEHIEGKNLEQLVSDSPLGVSQACEVIYQIAGALDVLHKRQLIHRDIKPSNILVTPQGTAKLLDFGLALHFGRNRLTMPGTVLGTLSYMAPEQVADAANVDIRADIFGLGGALFYCLAGRPPFVGQGNMTHQVATRLTQRPPELRTLRPDVPNELETVVQRMMAHEREERYPTPQALLRALLPFVKSPNLRGSGPSSDPYLTLPAGLEAMPPSAARSRVLVVDDQPGVRLVCKRILEIEGIACDEAGDGLDGLEKARQHNHALVLLDIDMPRLSGRETLRRLREDTSGEPPKVIMMSGGITPDEMAELLALGADDYVTKPLSRLALVSRVKSALAQKTTESRSSWLNQQLVRINAELEEGLTARNSDLIEVRNALLAALAEAVESRCSEASRGHLRRVSQLVGVLAWAARKAHRLAKVLDDAFIQIVEVCAPLHDIGNIAMPDHVLQRTGPLELEDRVILEAHTTIGAETLASVAKRDRSATAFWQTAVDVARHHHERFDGTGYPDRLGGQDIPLAARLVAVVDAYDRLRSPMELGVPLGHHAAVEQMVANSRGRFDPLLLQAFQECEAEFEQVYRGEVDRPIQV